MSEHAGIMNLSPFINNLRHRYAKGDSISSASNLIRIQMRQIHERGINTLKFNLGPLPFAVNHDLLVNWLTLGTIAFYEYLRIKGLPGAGTETILEPLALSSVSDRNTKRLGAGVVARRYKGDDGKVHGSITSPEGSVIVSGMDDQQTKDVFGK